jgi:hypothetical protein
VIRSDFYRQKTTVEIAANLSENCQFTFRGGRAVLRAPDRLPASSAPQSLAFQRRVYSTHQRGDSKGLAAGLADMPGCGLL